MIENILLSEMNIKAAAAQAMTAEEKDKLFKAIGYQENAAPTELPITYVATRLQFELNSLEISIKSDINGGKAVENVILLQLNQVQCAVSQRPSAQSIHLNLNMRELWVHGLHQKSFSPTLIRQQVKTNDSLLCVEFESNPIDKECDQRVKVKSQPIQIVYDGETIIQLLKVFQTPKTATISQLQDAAAERLVGIKERSASGLQYAISSHPRLELDIKLMPSYFLIPFGGMYRKNESLLVLSLGKLKIQTEPRTMSEKSVRTMHEKGAKADEILAELISQSYDKFMLEISDMQVSLFI